jgi:hypothetical protein
MNIFYRPSRISAVGGGRQIGLMKSVNLTGSSILNTDMSFTKPVST